MTTFTYWVLLVFIAYFAVLIGIAVIRVRRMDNMSDYVLGGRRMGVVTSALSAASSSSSGWTMLVFPALAFAAGLIHLWTAASIAFGAWLVWTVMGKRLRRYTIATDDSLTLPEFFEKRFLDRTGTLRTLSALQTHARVWLGRLMLLVVGAISALLSIYHPDSVFNLVSLAWGGMGAAFGPATILALYWRRFNFWGALTSISVGTVVATFWWLLPLGAEASAPLQALSGLWELMKAQPSGLWSIQPATPGFLIATPAAVLVTLLTPPPNREMTDLFDRVNGPAAASAEQTG